VGTRVCTRRDLVLLAVAAVCVGLLLFQWGRSHPQVHQAGVRCLSAPGVIQCDLPDDDWTISIPRDVAWTDAHSERHEDGRPDCLPPTGMSRDRSVRVWWTEVEAEGTRWRQVVMVGCDDSAGE